MLGYLSFVIIFATKDTVFLELRSRKIVHFLEQIMFAIKYPSMFSRQMEDIVYITIFSFFRNMIKTIILQNKCSLLSVDMSVWNYS